MKPGYTVYATPKKNSSRIGRCFAQGARLPYREIPCKLAAGGMASFGAHHGLRPLLARVQREGRPWIYVDNGYFAAKHFSGYYRATRNAYQHDGTGQASSKRWEQLGLSVAPWRRSGSFVLVCPPAPVSPDRGLDLSGWLPATLTMLKANTDREIRVREKTDRTAVPLAQALHGAHALVCWTSNAAVEALLAGVPVFCTAPCAAYRMGHSDLAKIEAPHLPPDREQWAWNLAANQWTLREMASGQCWRELMGKTAG